MIHLGPSTSCFTKPWSAEAATREVVLDGDHLTLEDVRDVAYGNAKALLDPKTHPRIAASRDIVDEILASEKVVYAVNTGFGVLSDVRIDREDVRQLQVNLLRSHAAGTGEPLPTEVVRAMMVLRANTLAKGVSGVRTVLLEQLLTMLDRGVHPIVPAQGSLGASGDLAPLAHLALVLIGEGHAEYEGETLDGAAALERAGIEPLVLEAKEGLALLNGTQMMTAIAVLAVLEAETLCRAADIAVALSLEGFEGSHRPFLPEVQDARPHPGQIDSASNCRRLLDGSPICAHHADCPKIQDPYSFRCAPQVHGAVRDSVAHVRRVVELEINAATDNPLVFPEIGEAVSQGNFHGEPIALATDFLAMAMAELGNISERRTDKLNDPKFSDLPAFLTGGVHGLNSGTMIVHYTAASLVSENKTLAHPASVDSIPTSANKEDHVSMGSIAARKAARVVAHVRTILATELFCGLQALRFREPLESGPGIEAAREFLGPRVEPIGEDRVFADDVARVAEWVGSGELVSAVETAIGALA